MFPGQHQDEEGLNIPLNILSRILVILNESSPTVSTSGPYEPTRISCPIRIQVCPKKGINPTNLLWEWDWDHQTTCSREGYGSLGMEFHKGVVVLIMCLSHLQQMMH